METIEDVAKICEITTHITNKNKNQDNYKNISNILPKLDIKKAYDVISSWPDYHPTPLINLNNIAKYCGIKTVLFKDESKRFKLKSFKALGGAYAVADLAAQHVRNGGNPQDLVVTTATDGNHGRSVAWGAKLANCRAEIFIHAHVSKAREIAMQELGANVIRINGNYEASLEACKNDANNYGWQVVSDTSWDGYTEIPLQVMAGYSVISTECMSQMDPARPTHAFLPVGVGGLAGGIVAPFLHELQNDMFKVITVESDMSACFLESIDAQKPKLVNITEETLMAGLSCGEVSKVAWELLNSTLSDCVSISDSSVASTMRLFANGHTVQNTNGSNKSIEAGECSTSGLTALLAICKNETKKQDFGLDKNSEVLLIGTEGATDPELYSQLLSASVKI
jgi:diaminopropionate ammonia-lyase